MNRRSFLTGTCAATLTQLGRLDPTSRLGAVESKTTHELVTANTQDAIDRALQFLARKQVGSGRNRGAFGTGGYPGGVAVTGIGGLAFMCGGSSPIGGPYSANVRACTDFVIANCRDTGYIARVDGAGRSNMYGHGYAMLYLSQVCGMSANPDVERRLERAIKLTESTQNDEGGWRYQPRKSDADLSITICQIMALRGARDAGFQVDDKVRTKCIEYVKRCQQPEGNFKYTLKGGRTSVALTAAGVVSLYSAGIYEGPLIEKSLEWLMERKPGTGKPVSKMNYYYGHYYGVQAMWHAQSQHPEYWNEWYTGIRDELLKSQKGDGSWPDKRVGPEFAAAMSAIILQMPFNFLPIFAP